MRTRFNAASAHSILFVGRCLLFMSSLFSGLSAAATVREEGGNIYFVADDGVPHQLTSLHADTGPVISPDGQQVAFVRTPPGSTESEASEIWLSDVSGLDTHRILVSQPSDNLNESLSQFNSLAFSTDAGRLYFLSAAWATSNAVHVVNLKTGKVDFVTDGNALRVVPSGRYAGMLIVQKHKYFKRSGSYDYYWLISPSGKEIKMAGKKRKGV